MANFVIINSKGQFLGYDDWVDSKSDAITFTHFQAMAIVNSLDEGLDYEEA